MGPLGNGGPAIIPHFHPVYSLELSSCPLLTHSAPQTVQAIQASGPKLGTT